MYGPYQGGTARPYKKGERLDRLSLVRAVPNLVRAVPNLVRAVPSLVRVGRTKSGKGRTKPGKGRTRESKNAVSSFILLQSCRKQTNSQQYQILRIYQ